MHVQEDFAWLAVVAVPILKRCILRTLCSWRLVRLCCQRRRYKDSLAQRHKTMPLTQDKNLTVAHESPVYPSIVEARGAACPQSESIHASKLC